VGRPGVARVHVHLAMDEYVLVSVGHGSEFCGAGKRARQNLRDREREIGSWCYRAVAQVGEGGNHMREHGAVSAGLLPVNFAPLSCLSSSMCLGGEKRTNVRAGFRKTSSPLLVSEPID
jgi:hypothetical protein